MLSYSLNSLIVFCEVIKLHSFSKAADALFMTQPGVSNHVAQLEAQAGSRLLVREKGRLKPTKEGKIIYKYAEKIDATARGLEGVLRTMRKDAKPLLKIATTPVYSRIMMPFILGSFQKANPDIMIKLDVGSSADMVKSVASMQNDVVIVASQKTSKKLFAYPLIKEDLVLITCNGHPLSKKQSVSLEDIAQYPLVIREEGSATRKVVLSAFDAKSIKPTILIDMKSTDFIKEWISQGKGISLLIRRAVLEDEYKYLKVVPLKDALSLEVSILFLKSRKYDRSIEKFLEYVKELKAQGVL
ncbi:MAG TPA: LysR family transcriptional regulator [Syntrophorhabdaceae bacterium]|jgi:DNA-binding transcriptional LysR family regulator